MIGYSQVVTGTTFLAAAIVVVFLILVLRRYLAERSKAQRDERDAAITRNYLHRVAGHRVDDSARWSRSVRLAAVTRILPLLKGGERARLLQIAELDGVLAETLRRSHSMFRAERISAIHFLQRFGSEVCVARLRQLMAHDSSSRVQLEAAFALAANNALPPPRESLRILNALSRQPTRLDVALLRATAPLYPAQMVLLLEDDLPSEWRAQIIDALGWSGDMGTIDLLERAAADPDPEIRRAALRASAKLGHPAAERWILPALNDPITSVRLQAIAASVSLGLRSALPDLTTMRSDEELWIRLRVEQAFDRLAPEQNAALPRDGAR